MLCKTKRSYKTVSTTLFSHQRAYYLSISLSQLRVKIELTSQPGDSLNRCSRCLILKYIVMPCPKASNNYRSPGIPANAAFHTHFIPSKYSFDLLGSLIGTCKVVCLRSADAITPNIFAIYPGCTTFGGGFRVWGDRS
jgi:hypothetical protein